MSSRPSGLDRERLAKARALLNARPKRRPQTWTALAAAALAAVSALVLAGSTILAPPAPWPSEDVVADLR